MISKIIDNTYIDKNMRKHGTTIIQICFENENLEGQISIKGDEAAALSYLPIFEADLRYNFSDLFPVPEIPAMPKGGDL